MAFDNIELQPTLQTLINIAKENISNENDSNINILNNNNNNNTTSNDIKISPNIYPVYAFIPADFLNPNSAYLKLTKGAKLKHSFLFESAHQGEQIGRYSFLGINPHKVIKTGNGFGPNVDPLILLQEYLENFQQAQIPGVPNLSGGAVGFVSYDCIKYFEPKSVKNELKDVLHIPESIFMIYDTIVAFDHVYQKVQVITNIHINNNTNNLKIEEELKKSYHEAKLEIQKISSILLDNTCSIPLPKQEEIFLKDIENENYISNIGKEGYESHVIKLKNHILKGDIIQAVPSQRLSRKTKLHPFNIYRHLRTVNPSPYMFYIDCDDFQIVGASPELLVKCDSNNHTVTHPIAGTVPRGKTLEEDNKLAKQLSDSLKDRAEHVMLVDLARNDINRVCDPHSTVVNRLMNIERFSHVMHLVSEVSGTLRPDKTRFDAFRSIFPAGTVSGAPKVKAMELISELEGERRGVYAGAVGHWAYEKSTMDTCIALRTMMIKDGVAYLQAGGGIVFDSDENDEYLESMNKLRANMQTIIDAEKNYATK